MGPLRDVSSRDAGRFVEWAVATQRMPGESALGDRAIVKEFTDGALIGAIDGLGHGEEAAAAAQRAVDLLERHIDEPVEALIRRCHDHLRSTRGVVMSLGSVNAREDTMTWVGVGNVEALVSPAAPALKPQRIVPCPGIVGYKLPRLRLSTLSLQRGDMVVFATDGIGTDFAVGLRPVGSARRIADRILGTYNKGTDDALVLVARYLGGEP